eukprot:282227_1
MEETVQLHHFEDGTTVDNLFEANFVTEKLSGIYCDKCCPEPKTEAGKKLIKDDPTKDKRTSKEKSFVKPEGKDIPNEFIIQPVLFDELGNKHSGTINIREFETFCGV